MKNIIKTAGYSLVAFTSVAYSNVSAIDFGQNKVDQRIRGTKDGTGNIYQTINDLIAWLLTFLAIIAVIFAIYAGFQILTAGGDEEKVKKGKTTLINALLGIFVIWISWSLVNWVMSGLSAGVTS